MYIGVEGITTDVYQFSLVDIGQKTTSIKIDQKKF